MKTEQNTNDCRSCLYLTILHLSAWAALFIGLWFHWKWAMIIGFFSAIGNLRTYGLLFVFSAIGFLISTRFANHSFPLLNFALFFLASSCLQVWQFLFWIDGAAAH